jgi:hypothetical protein
MRDAYKMLVRNPDFGIDGRIILKWALSKYTVEACSLFVWFKI